MDDNPCRPIRVSIFAKISVDLDSAIYRYSKTDSAYQAPPLGAGEFTTGSKIVRVLDGFA